MRDLDGLSCVQCRTTGAGDGGLRPCKGTAAPAGSETSRRNAATRGESVGATIGRHGSADEDVGVEDRHARSTGRTRRALRAFRGPVERRAPGPRHRRGRASLPRVARRAVGRALCPCRVTDRACVLRCCRNASSGAQARAPVPAVIGSGLEQVVPARAPVGIAVGHVVESTDRWGPPVTQRAGCGYSRLAAADVAAVQGTLSLSSSRRRLGGDETARAQGSTGRGSRAILRTEIASLDGQRTVACGTPWPCPRASGTAEHALMS